ncbi:MAG: carboxylate-amine ligase [Candidatus Dormibacteria bacterium]
MDPSALEAALAPPSLDVPDPDPPQPLGEWRSGGLPFSLGAELELQLVNGETGHLISLAPALLAALHAAFPDDTARFQRELMENTVEVTSSVCRSVSDLAENLRGYIGRAVSMAALHGATVISAGSHPVADPYEQRITDAPRMTALLNEFGRGVREALTFGLHVHVGVDDGADAMAAGNVLLQHVPQLLALSTSSPFWDGRDSGLSSSRCPQYTSFGNTGIPPIDMRTMSDYRRHYQELIEAGTIRSNSDIHYVVRPSPHQGTIEVRIADATPTLREAMAIAAYVQCLVADVPNDPAHRHPVSRTDLVANKSAVVNRSVAANVRDLDGTVRPVWYCIERDIERLRPVAERLGCSSQLEDNLKILNVWGPSSERQRVVCSLAPDASGAPLSTPVPKPHERLDPHRAAHVLRSLNREFLADSPQPPQVLSELRQRVARDRGPERAALAAADPLRGADLGRRLMMTVEL